MSSSSPSQPDRHTTSPRVWLLRIVLGLAGGAVGLAAGYWIGRLAKTGVLNDNGWTWSDLAALAIAAGLGALGLLILLMSVSAKGVALLIDPANPRPLRPPQVRFARTQGIAAALAGIMLALPVAAESLGVGDSAALGGIVLSGIAVLFFIQTLANLSIWRRGDEHLRTVIAETGAVSFWLMQGGLFLWAAAEKLGVAPAASAWDLTVALMGGYLVISSVVAFRRGLS